MSLDCAINNVVKPITSFACNTVKDYVSYIRSYDDNMNTLKENLQELCSKKQDINTKVKNGKGKLEKITKEAAYWLQRVRKLSKNEELRKLVLLKIEIAEEVLKLMDEKDVKKLIREDTEMQEVVIKAVKMHNNKNDQEFEGVTRVVVEVMKDTMEEFKKVLKEDVKVAMVATRLLKDEELERLSLGDSDMVDVLNIARKKCEEKSWEILSDTEEESELEGLRKLPTPLEKLTQNENFMNALPENEKLGVEIMDAFWKSSIGLKDEIIASKKLKDGGRQCFCCYYFVVPFRHFNRLYEMSKIAQLTANDIKTIIENMPKDPVTLPGKTLKAIPSGFLKGLESREEILREILSKLQDDQVNSVGVYGIGGTGKTTLIKEVNSKAKSYFDTILMVEVSENPNIERIQDQIAEALDLKLNNVHSLSQRAMTLYTRIKQGKEQGRDKKGKTLIILDNMWHKIDLLQVGIPCESTNDFCCKLLVTSREKNLCHMMGIIDDNIFWLRLLSDNESEKLFYHHVGERFEGDFRSIAQRLLSKCGGLSLTIVATANALKGKDLPMWQHFADELEKPISSQITSVRHETYAILETSYRFIETEEKKMFFLLVCMAPRGSSISIENLMRYGIGLDLFQHVNKLSEALEQAETWVVELISSSLLMEGDSQFDVKIHDDVRASAISFATKDKHVFLVEAIPRWMCKETFNKYTFISLLSGGHDFSYLNGVKAEMLQILLLKGNNSDTSELFSGFFEGMPNLKVLHLSYMNLNPELPESIRELKNLRTLQLEHCKLGKISFIYELKELLIISLRFSYLDEFPKEMGKLVNLRMLDLYWCTVNSPTNCNVIASLSSLEGLYLFRNFNDWVKTATESNDTGETDKIANISEFRELPHLSLLEEVRVQNPTHLPVGRFYKNLDRFSITIGDFYSFSKWIIDRRLRRRTLEFGRTGISIYDALLKDNNCLKALLKRAYCLRLYDISLENNIFIELVVEGVRDLKYLELNDCYNMESVISIEGLNYDLTAFQNLMYLILVRLFHLKNICKEETPPGMFSNLQHLRLCDLVNLEYAMPLAQLPRNLTEITIDNCSSLRYIFSENNYVSSDVAIELPRLKSMVIKSSSVLVCLLGPAPAADLSIIPEAMLESQAFFNRKIMCPSLELLHLYYCNKIEYLWSKDLDMSNFQNLRKIEIQSCENLRSLGPASVFPTLMQLESLSIMWCEGMNDVIIKETNEPEISQKSIEFRQLMEFVLHCSQKLDSFYGGRYKVEFPKLKKLRLTTLRDAAFVVSEDPTALFNDKIMCPSLELLELKFCDKIKYFWSKELDMTSFQNLIKIEIDSCKNLQSLGPPSIFSALMQLGSLFIDWCESMKYVISKETNDHEIPQKTIEFRQLRKLRLKNLKNIESFYGGSYKVEFPKLKKLNLCNLPKMNAFVGSEDLTTLFRDKVRFPNLEELKMIKVIKDTHTQLWNWDSSIIEDVPKLRKLTLDIIKGLRLIPPRISANISSLHLKNDYQSSDKFVFATSGSSSACVNSSHLPKLEQMCVQSFQWLENLFENEDNGIATFCRHLRQLELNGVPKLKLIPLHLFENLFSLHISHIRWKYVFPSHTVVRGLKLLEDVYISDCEQMEFVIQDEQDNGQNDNSVMFPRLKTLRLKMLKNIHTFSSRPNVAMYLPSLVTLQLENCDKMEVLWAGPLVAPELKEVKVWYCLMLRFLCGKPNQVVELLSLENVSVGKAYKMKSLCAGPFKAPNLDASSKSVLQ